MKHAIPTETFGLTQTGDKVTFNGSPLLPTEAISLHSAHIISWKNGGENPIKRLEFYHLLII